GVVTSNGEPSAMTVTVPWSMPVGTALSPACLASAITLSGSAVVARSTSLTGSPSNALRTAPPTARVSTPSPWSASSTANVCPRFNHSASAREGVAEPHSSRSVIIGCKPSVDSAGLDDPILVARRMVGAAGLAPQKLDQRRDGEKQEPASRREQPHQRRAVPQVPRHRALDHEHISSVDQKRQGKHENVDQSDAEHHKSRLGRNSRST